MPELLQKTFDVKVGDDVFTFRVPTIRFDIEVSYQSADIRRRAFPSGGGNLQDADALAYNMSRGGAYMELYLERATTTWPFSAGPDGKPVVDFMRFPPHLADQVYEVRAGFDEEYGRFRRTGSFDIRPAGPETVAGEQNPGAS